jgi:hypothetical protein
MAQQYELNEKDIDSVIGFLKIHDPEHATPEMAIALLEHMQATFHTMAHESPELLEQLYEDFKNKKPESER